MLADATGTPLVVHTWQRACSVGADRVIVATDHDAIHDACQAAGADVVMTRADHPNGTSRLAEVLDTIPADDVPDVIVNLQGDEPEIEPRVIHAAITTLSDHPDCVVGTVASPFQAGEDPRDPNIVKVVCDQVGRALYFSRAPIPHVRDAKDATDASFASGAAPLKHIGLYVYRPDFLRRYVDLPVGRLETSEKLEQLRILEAGERISVAITPAEHVGIDTPEDYAAFTKRWHASQST